MEEDPRPPVYLELMAAVGAHPGENKALTRCFCAHVQEYVTSRQVSSWVLSAKTQLRSLAFPQTVFDERWD